MRDDNKIFGQCIYAAARSYTIHAAMRMFRIVYINDLLRLFYANHPNTDKPKGESMILLIVMD
jgi:hypothetical protein